ncbi:MAG: hypothetical protein HZB53_06205 [Chloroflexi bacterium]|nr:hypothetical protein [Chloroflexota bacterium]
MDVEVSEVNTTLRLMDSQVMLNPQIKEQLFSEFVARFLAQMQQQSDMESGRELRAGASVRASGASRGR